MKPYSILVQASPDEILEAKSPNDLNLQELQGHACIEKVLVVLPDFEDSGKAKLLLNAWGFNTFIGDSYNIARRLWNANQTIEDQDYVVRVLAIWKHIDLSYVDRLVQMIQNEKVDYILVPKNVEITMAADVASEAILSKLSQLDGEDAFSSRARFNPFSAIEAHAEDYKTLKAPTLEKYPSEKVEELISSERLHPENEFFGRDYSGSRYHFLEKYIPDGSLVMDIACGAAFGSDLMSEKASKVVGVDYLESYIQVAKKRYEESDKLEFHVGDAMNFIYNDKKSQFDVIVSLHTLEHVPDDGAMLKNLYENLKPGGLLILEIPLQMQLPLGVPINPYHFREYEKVQIHRLIEEAGFSIVRSFGSIRGIYVGPDLARDAYQIHAMK